MKGLGLSITQLTLTPNQAMKADKAGGHARSGSRSTRQCACPAWRRRAGAWRMSAGSGGCSCTEGPTTACKARCLTWLPSRDVVEGQPSLLSIMCTHFVQELAVTF